MRTIQNQTFDEERALYGSSDILVKDCSFDGPADGESAFKECSECAGGSTAFLTCVILSGMTTALQSGIRR